MRLSAIRYTALLALTLVACSAEPPLSLADKVKATRELLAERTECADFTKQLNTATDRQQVDQTYQAAKSAHCIKPDV